MEETLREALTSMILFGNMRQEELQDLERILKPRTFHLNEVIFQKGDPGDSLYIIREGRVKICVMDPEGTELVFAFLSKGDLLGELAVLDGQSRSATAIAVEETQTLYIKHREFLDFLQATPHASIGIILMLCKRLRETDKHLEEISFLDVAARVARKVFETFASETAITESGELSSTSSFNQEELAHMVGASRVMVNKVLNSFASTGYIEIGRKKITVLNKAELYRIARYEA